MFRWILSSVLALGITMGGMSTPDVSAAEKPGSSKSVSKKGKGGKKGKKKGKSKKGKKKGKGKKKAAA